MEIIFDRRPGRIMDLINSLKFIYNDSFHKFTEGLEVKPNKDVENILKHLEKKGNFDWKYNEIFFCDEFPLIDFIIDSNDMWDIKDESEVIDYIKNISEEAIVNKIINLLNSNVKDKKLDCKEIMNDDKKLMDLIDRQELSDGLKWKLIGFIKNTSKYIERLISSLNVYIKVFDEVMDKNVVILDEFSRYVEEEIKVKGVNFLGELTDDILEYYESNDIYLSTTLINCYSLQGGLKKDKVIFFMGIEFPNLMRKLKGIGETEKNLNIFKNLCDKSRFQILKMLLNKGMYAQELAEKLGVSMPTVSYHINFLLSVNLVIVEKQEGRKVYYILNKKVLENSVDFLKDTFNL